jgi:hypothetical protein
LIETDEGLGPEEVATAAAAAARSATTGVATAVATKPRAKRATSIMIIFDRGMLCGKMIRSMLRKLFAGTEKVDDFEGVLVSIYIL